jgi:hypothetical protein
MAAANRVSREILALVLAGILRLGRRSAPGGCPAHSTLPPTLMETACLRFWC